jgi:hypothetical protein
MFRVLFVAVATSQISATTLELCLAPEVCATTAQFNDAATEYPLSTTTAQCRACVKGVSVEDICVVFITNGCPDITTTIDPKVLAAATLVSNFRVEFDVDNANEEELIIIKEALRIAFGDYRDLRRSDVIDLHLTAVEGSKYAKIVIYLRPDAREQIFEEGPLGFQKGLDVLLADGTKLHVHNGDVVDVDAIKGDGKPINLEGSGDNDAQDDAYQNFIDVTKTKSPVGVNTATIVVLCVFVALMGVSLFIY